MRRLSLFQTLVFSLALGLAASWVVAQNDTTTGRAWGPNVTWTGLIKGSRLESTVATGTAPFTVASTTQVANLNAATAGTASSATAMAFSGLSSATNSTAAMVLGTGASLTVSGSGTNNATTLGGATFAAPGAIGGGTPAAGSFTTVSGSTSVSGATYLTATNCADGAGAAACGSAAAGRVVVDAGATTVVVSTTAVTANSEIFVQYDSSLGTALSVTCNTTVALPSVTARTAATSFTLTVPVAPAVNPACYSYRIVN
jgi:hypothetical protein